MFDRLKPQIATPSRKLVEKDQPKAFVADVSCSREAMQGVTSIGGGSNIDVLLEVAPLRSAG